MQKELELVKLELLLLLHVFFSSAELNQRALVGRTAAVFPFADPTVEQSINETMRYTLKTYLAALQGALGDISTWHIII